MIFARPPVRRYRPQAIRVELSLGLAVALTLRGRQHCGPVGRRAGVAAAKISTALDTLAGTDEALAASPAIQRLRKGAPSCHARRTAAAGPAGQYRGSP
jgi:hypothetical protein